MGHDQMLRVSKVDEWLRRAPPRPDMSTHGDCVIIRSGRGPDGAQGIGLASRVTRQSAGAQGLCLNLVMIPPGSRGMPHFHDRHETAIYTVSGQTEVWHGHGLAKRTVVARRGLYVHPAGDAAPAGEPGGRDRDRRRRAHRPDGHETDPTETESRVVVELPRHLADLLSLPIAVQE